MALMTSSLWPPGHQPSRHRCGRGSAALGFSDPRPGCSPIRAGRCRLLRRAARRGGQQRHQRAAHRLLGAGRGSRRRGLDDPDHVRGQRQLRTLLRRDRRLRGYRPAHLQPMRGPLEPRSSTQAKEGRPLPKVVIPVHLCGQPCDMAAIHALAGNTDSRSSRMPRTPSARATRTSPLATALTATSPSSVSIRSRSSRPAKAAWR